MTTILEVIRNLGIGKILGMGRSLGMNKDPRNG